MKPVLEQMKRTGEIAVQEIPVGRHVEHRVVPLRAANVDVLAPTDVAMINEVIALTWDKTGSQVSDFSHGRAWEVAGENGAPIPYEAALLADRLVPSAAQVARSRELNRKYAWE
jgi:hypothetical protein